MASRAGTGHERADRVEVAQRLVRLPDGIAAAGADSDHRACTVSPRRLSSMAAARTTMRERIRSRTPWNA